MLTDKHLEELCAERRADYLAAKAREEGGAVQEAIANADAHASNVGLPSYSELVEALRKARETVWRAPVVSAPDQEQAERIRDTCTELSLLLARLPK